MAHYDNFLFYSTFNSAYLKQTYALKYKRKLNVLFILFLNVFSMVWMFGYSDKCSYISEVELEKKHSLLMLQKKADIKLQVF